MTVHDTMHRPTPPPPPAPSESPFTESVAAAGRLIDNVRRVIRGVDDAVTAAATALFAGGHLLIDDVPGVGKTMLARAFARSIDGTFKRIQATPDLLPADITGSAVYHQVDGSFEFVPGPLFANVVLIDEINRTTPRTQSALLEAMDENATTVDGIRHELPHPLFVVATQNPVEHHGTFPLPEGQLDRFAIAMAMGYVPLEIERDVIAAQLGGHPIDDLAPVLTTREVVAVQRAAASVHAAGSVIDYALAITHATRSHSSLQLGASPRASITLVRCAQARALIKGRDFMVPDDVKALAVPVLAHRVVPRAELRYGSAGSGTRAASSGVGSSLEPGRTDDVIAEILTSTPAPVTGPLRR
ncbi:MAG: AAA family ATPase [Actinomycetota bacterium]